MQQQQQQPPAQQADGELGGLPALPAELLRLVAEQLLPCDFAAFARASAACCLAAGAARPAALRKALTQRLSRPGLAGPQVSDVLCRQHPHLVVPVGITDIRARAFVGCRALESVVLPAGLVSVGRDAFGECVALVSVTLPSTLRSVAGGAFCACMSLRSAELPAACEEVGDRAFWMCAGMETVSISAALTVIQTGTFMDCTALVRVAIPADAALMAVAPYAFMGCRSLRSIELPSTVTYISPSAFEACISLDEDSRERIRRVNPNAEFHAFYNGPEGAAPVPAAQEPAAPPADAPPPGLGCAPATVRQSGDAGLLETRGRPSAGAWAQRPPSRVGRRRRGSGVFRQTSWEGARCS